MTQQTINSIVGCNIKAFRQKLGLTQDNLAIFLEISREEVNYYENGKRPVPAKVLSKAANLFGIDEYDLYEEDPSVNCINLSFAFRADEIKQGDLVQIADFKKIVINYLGMKKALEDERPNTREKG